MFEYEKDKHKISLPEDIKDDLDQVISKKAANQPYANLPLLSGIMVGVRGFEPPTT